VIILAFALAPRRLRFLVNAAISIAIPVVMLDLDRHAEPGLVARRPVLCGNRRDTLNESPRHRAASLMTEG